MATGQTRRVVVLRVYDSTIQRPESGSFDSNGSDVPEIVVTLIRH
jgi:hypothetical protein